MTSLEIAGTPVWRPHVLPHLEGEDEAPEVLRLEGLSVEALGGGREVLVALPPGSSVVVGARPVSTNHPPTGWGCSPSPAKIR